MDYIIPILKTALHLPYIISIKYKRRALKDVEAGSQNDQEANSSCIMELFSIAEKAVGKNTIEMYKAIEKTG